MPFTKFVPKQKRMSTTLGGMLILLSETVFMFSLLNFVLVTRIQYYNPGDAYMRQLFPHYLLFLGILVATALLGMIFVYIFILPNKVTFSQQQAVKDDRSPTHNLLIQVESEIKDLKKDIEALKQSLDKV